jgi:hypothetical protein
MRHSSRLPAVFTSAALVVLAGCAAIGTPSVASPTVVPVATAQPTASATAVASSTASPSADVGGCLNASVDFAPDARGQKGDPIDLARSALSGLRGTDVLTRAAGSDSATTQIVISREGREIGRVQFDQDPDGGWLLGQATLCGGLGLPS